MRLIGLTGRSGSGKSTFARAAIEKNIPVMDCDSVYAGLTNTPGPLQDALKEQFGPVVIADGKLNRPLLRSLVFGDQKALDALNGITAFYMKQAIDDFCASLPEDTPFVILDAPTLFETGLDAICDTIVGVIAPDALLLQRIMARDGIDEAAAYARLSNQHPNSFFLAHCDRVLWNDGTLEELQANSLSLLASLTEP